MPDRISFFSAFLSPQKRAYRLPLLFCIAAVIVLLCIPTGFEGTLQFRDAVRCRARVLDVNDERVVDTGLVRSGQQVCTVEFLSGKFKGMRAEGFTLLSGSLETDTVFVPGDVAQVIVHYRQEESGGVMFLSVHMLDHYRLGSQAVLAICFALFLICFSGWTGVRAVFSFAFTVLLIWKVLVPLYLKGVDPIAAGIAAVLVLTVVIIALVYGFDLRCAAAVSGAFAGVLTAYGIGALCTGIFRIHGAVMTRSESLLYSGFEDLNLTRIFTAGIFIGAAGAMMDLAVDITSAVHEIVRKKPDIGRRELCASAMNIARAAMGTMTTTLLLSYSGGCITLLMVFMAQGTPVYNILNYRHMSAQILDILAGSFGLVTVGPFTAAASSFVLVRNKNTEKNNRKKGKKELTKGREV